MADTPITAQIHQSLDIHRYLASQITFNDEVGYRGTQIGDLGFSQILDPGIRSDARCAANLLRARVSNSENSRQCNHDVLVYRYINACYSSHLNLPYSLALTLFVPGVSADYAHNTFAANDLTVSTHFLY